LERGLVSIVATASPGHHIEIGMVGHEGMTGLSILLESDRSPNETLVQSPGTALRISTESLRRTLEASLSLTATLLRYVNVFMVQSSQTALANGRGLLDERLARWLLMWHDRVESGILVITHELLARMLVVHRPGVTDALHKLEGKGIIRTTPSQIQIRDRKSLQLAANGFYGIPEAEYDRSFGLEE
jgi:CRP-like cAMP-binding protein